MRLPKTARNDDCHLRIVRLDRPDIIDSAGDGYLRAGGAFKHGHGVAAPIL